MRTKEYLVALCISVLCITANAQILKPEHLKHGDTVALVAPGFQFDKDKLTFAVRRLKALGLNPIYDKNILDNYGYFAGMAQVRAKEINGAINNPKVKAIIALRGGYGTADVLSQIDYQALKKNPKIIMGYSDITALLTAVYDKTGLVSFHGPLGFSTWTPFTTAHVKAVLFGNSRNYVLKNQRKKNQDKDLIDLGNPDFTITPGVAKGTIIGGNLSVLVSLIGTPYFPKDWKGKILFLEDVGEDVYSIDRMLGQLKHIGVLSQIAGFIFGTCSKCTSKVHGGFYLNEVLDHYIKPLGIPAYRGAMIGHQDNIFTVPVGLPVKLDANKKTITLLESATK